MKFLEQRYTHVLTTKEMKIFLKRTKWNKLTRK